MRHHLVVLTAAALAAATTPVRAQDAPPRLRTQFDLSFVQASGNTRLTTLHLSEKLVYHPAPWKVTQTFAVVNGRSEGVPTANSITAGLRGDRELTPRFRVYGQVGYERDRFADLRRRLREEAGVSWSALAAPRNTLDTEAGIGLTQEAGYTTAARDFASSRAAARYRHVFRANTYFEGKTELLSNLEDGDDNRVNADLALVAPISRNVSLKLGYVVRYDQQPEPGKRATDTIGSAGLQIVF
jgi:putative salt-induced outer membrane protein